MEGVRIEEIEHKIGAGLIEEVIQVAEGEEQLVDVMIRDRVKVIVAALQGSYCANLFIDGKIWKRSLLRGNGITLDAILERQ